MQLLASVRFDVFEKIKRKILLYSDIAGLFGYHILLNVVVGELACNLEVVYMPLAGNGQPRKVIGEPESFLTRHQPIRVVVLSVLRLQQPETPPTEHTAPVVLREDRVPADISNCVVAESLAFVVNEDVHVIL